MKNPQKNAILNIKIKINLKTTLEISKIKSKILEKKVKHLLELYFSECFVVKLARELTLVMMLAAA